MLKSIKFTIILIITVLNIISCSGVDLTQWHFPYMMEVQQGTYITNDQYRQLKTGMTKEQIAYIIGKPLSQDMFNQKQWDFIYQDYKNDSLKKKYQLTILFDKNDIAYNITRTGNFFEK